MQDAFCEHEFQAQVLDAEGVLPNYKAASLEAPEPRWPLQELPLS